MIEIFNVLIIADPSFEDKVNDASVYRSKLYNLINDKHNEKDLTLKTVNGKYTFGLNEGLKIIEVNDKNKTAFVKSLTESIDKIDEVFFVTNYPDEPFLESLRNQLNENSVGLSIYGYEVKTDEIS